VLGIFSRQKQKEMHVADGAGADGGAAGTPPPPPPAARSPRVAEPAPRGDGGDGGGRGSAVGEKRVRDKAESADEALVPHEPLSRVMRRALKPTTHIERSAVKTVQVGVPWRVCAGRVARATRARRSGAARSPVWQACVSELVMVVVGEATEHAMKDDRRTLTAEDILWALRELGAPAPPHPAPARVCLSPAARSRAGRACALY